MITPLDERRRRRAAIARNGEHIVYTIHESEFHLPFYVGQTCNLASRINHHLALRTNSTADEIRQLLADDIVPLFRIAGRVTGLEAALQAESELIGYWLAQGAELHNPLKDLRDAARMLEAAPRDLDGPAFPAIH